MADGSYKLIKENSGGTHDEKVVLAENGKILGFDSGLNPIMITPATGAELDTATDTVKHATAKGLKDSKYQRIHIGTTAPSDTTMMWYDTN